MVSAVYIGQYKHYHIQGGGGKMSKARILREKMGISIAQMSYEIKANPSTLSCMERRRLAPSEGVRQRVCEFFGVPESKLFDADGLVKM